MSTKNEQEKPLKANPEIFQPPAKVDNSSEIIASLEERLVSAQERLCEERFLWLVAVVGLVMTSFIFAGLSGFGLVFVSALAVVLLAGFANMWGIDWAVQLMDWVMSKIPNGK